MFRTSFAVHVLVFLAAAFKASAQSSGYATYNPCNPITPLNKVCLQCMLLFSFFKCAIVVMRNLFDVSNLLALLCFGSRSRVTPL
jgi:hypothetical protein